MTHRATGACVLPHRWTALAPCKGAAMEEAVLSELRGYMARRVGGGTPAGEELVRKAARLYVSTVKALRKHGGGDRRFWEVMYELSHVFDRLRDDFMGDADWYFVSRQWEELVLPALREVKMRQGRGVPVIAEQLSVVGDMVIHTHCEALSSEQQQQGLHELCRVWQAAPRDENYGGLRYCVLSAIGKLIFMTTRRGHFVDDFERRVDLQVAAEAGRRGILRLALESLEDPAGVMGGGIPFPGDDPGLRDENEQHLVQSAQIMAGALLATQDPASVSVAATAARWVASKPRLVRRLLGKMRAGARPPAHGLPTMGAPYREEEFALASTRLAALLASASPPLLEALKEGGLEELMGRARSMMPTRREATEVKAWEELLFNMPAHTRARLAGQWQRASFEGVADYAAFLADPAAAAGDAPQAPQAQQQAQQQQAQQQQAQQPAQQQWQSREQLEALPVRELKQRLAALRIDSSRCVGKEELVDLLVEAMPPPPQQPAAAAAGGSGDGAGTAAEQGAGSGEQQQQQQSGEQQQRDEEVVEDAAPGPPLAALGKRCSCCGATKASGVKLRLCGGCREPGFYMCSDACQRQLWPGHKEACKAVRRRQREEQEQELRRT